MIREKKCKAILKREKALRGVYGIDFLNKKVLVMIACVYEWREYKVLVDYIGYDDKKDIPLYEGDIVKVNWYDDDTMISEYIGIVKYNPEEAKYFIEGYYTTKRRIYIHDFICFSKDIFHDREMERIGSNYENPELFKMETNHGA